MKIKNNKFRIKKFGKKAFVDDLLYWIPKLIYYNVVVIVIILMLISFIKANVQMQEVEQKIYANRVIYAMDSISYYDESLFRTYPGIIDINKFNEEVLNNSMSFKNSIENENTYIAMNLSLKYQNSGDEVLAYHNKQWYERFLPRVDKKGRGGAKMLTEERFVLVRDSSGKTEPATLTIRIIMPNE